jgi:signal transduction histidine kinase/PAS domain-containing protein
MTTYAVTGLLILTGICAYAAINHAINAFHQPFSRVHFLFSLCCVALAAFELFHYLTYTAPTLADYIPRLKGEITAIILLFIVLPWFISEYSEIRPLWILLGLSTIALIALVVNALQPFSMQFSQISRLEHVDVPWAGTISRPVGHNGRGYFFGAAGVLVAFVFSVYALVVRYYRDRMGTTLVMLIAMGIFVATGIEGMLVRMSIVEFIHLGPYGILAMVIAMSIALNQEMREKLRASENRYRSLVDQSPFSMQVLSSDGRTLQVNNAWEQLWGVKAKDITGYNPLQDEQLKGKGVVPYLKQGFAGKATQIPPIRYDPSENPAFQGPANDRWVRAYVYPVKDNTSQVREVVLLHEDVTQEKLFDDAIQLIVSVVSGKTGSEFFQLLTKSLAELFSTSYCFIGVLDNPEARQVSTIAVYTKGGPAPNMTYDLQGTPCDMVMGKTTCIYPRDVQRLFPEDGLLVEMNAVGYLGTPLFDPEGKPLGIIVLIDNHPLHDIGQMKAIMEIVAARSAAEIERIRADELLQQQRRRLQEMVDERTVELQNANRELEAFSYSVSHDLRAPLRSIDGFSHALLDDYADQLNEQGRDYLDRIRGNAQRMSMLIDDLLQLSRVTRKTLNKKQINLSELVEETIKKYQEQNLSRKVKIKIAPDIGVNADPDLLAIVIDNLVSNAWKYTSKTEYAQIEFGLERRDGKPIYYVKDNGAGFDMRFSEKIFQAFQRLHADNEYEGSGIGLATVARIINRHGGIIWAEAQVNVGTTIYFWLPGSN